MADKNVRAERQEAAAGMLVTPLRQNGTSINFASCDDLELPGKAMRCWEETLKVDIAKLRSGHDTVDAAMQAMRLNAAAYCSILRSYRASGVKSLRFLVSTDPEAGEPNAPKRLTPTSAFWDVLRGPQYCRYTHILIEGETGTGKSIFAKMLCDEFKDEVRRLHPHGLFTDTNGKFSDKGESTAYRGTGVELNCGTIQKEFVISALFGTVKGAYNDAKDHPGLFLSAFLESSAVFLDEILEMPLDYKGWSALSTYMEGGLMSRMGAPELQFFAPVPIVAATNRDVEESIRAGEFRRDIRRRFSIGMSLPPIREEPELLKEFIGSLMSNPAVNPLAESAMRERKEGRLSHKVGAVDAKALDRLLGFQYPFNLRDLADTLSASCKRAIQAHAGKGAATMLEDHVEYVINGTLERTDAVFGLYIAKDSKGNPRLLLLFNDDWEHYFFLGGRSDNIPGTRVPAQALRKKLEDRLGIGKSMPFHLHPLQFKAPKGPNLEYLEHPEYSRHYLRYKAYRFFFFALVPDNPKLFEECLVSLEYERLVAWADRQDILSGCLRSRAEPFRKASPAVPALLKQVELSLDPDASPEAKAFLEQLKSLMP